MRDMILAAVMAVWLPAALFRPDLGALAWAWLSIMNPHTLAFGFARTIPWAQLSAIATLIGLAMVAKRRYRFQWGGAPVLIIMLMAWMVVTSVFSLNDPVVVWDRWIFVFKSMLMLFVTMAVLHGRTDIERLMWVIVVSLAFYGIKGGIWTIYTGGGGRVWGPPGGMIAGNNELAVALVLVMPWMYYLMQTSKRRLVRWGLAGGMLFTAFGILGTQSRGALLSLVAMGIMLGLKSKHPFRLSLMLLVVGMLVFSFMPESWTERMDTIQDFRADRSAMSRLWTWQTLWNLAVDRPLVGGGFGSDSREVFSIYSPVEGRGEFSHEAFVAHSIYMQALGEHGFPGLFLYLAIGFWTWWAARSLSRQTQDDPDFRDWVPLLMRMCQASLLGFAVGGAFLSLMNLDVPYYLPAVVVLTRATVAATRASRAAAGAGPAPAAAPNAPLKPPPPSGTVTARLTQE